MANKLVFLALLGFGLVGVGMAQHNYGQAIKLSNLFYEAQRSGKLPTDNKVAWRKDSFLTDGSDNGVNLSGGYFDAGDYVKFGFPMAYTITALCWGLIDYKAGYDKAGETANTLRTIRWGTDYFIKCHPAGSRILWGQCGDGNSDHASWTRPQDYTGYRPSAKIDASNGGSDLAAETAAALAAASIVFKATDPTYSALCLQHARELYSFANSVRKLYHDSIINAGGFYRSSGFGDELCWAATWLHRATGEAAFLSDARARYTEFNLQYMPPMFSWDDKKAGCYANLCRITKEAQYCNNLRTFCTNSQNAAKTASGGLIFLDIWGSARYASNAAFLMFQCTQLGQGNFSTVAKQQINYLLGTNRLGMSYQIGYGTKYPLRPHHRAASCPVTGTCGWDQLKTTNPNPNILMGALVGGPKKDDSFPDSREDYQTNEVATDYNACFQGALAACLIM